MDIVGFGALNFDMLFKVERIASGGDEVFIEREESAPGGSAANTIYGLAKLGKKTSFIGAVGGDEEGERILSDFKKVGVDTTCVKVRDGGRTGLILGFVDLVGERALYALPRVNDSISIGDIDIGYIERAEILHLTSFVGRKQLDVQKILTSKLSNRVSFSPGALYTRRGLEALLPIVKRCYVIFLNKSEVEFLTRKDYKMGAKMLVEKGCGIVVVTLGGEGCYVTNGTQDWEVGVIPTEVVDTTGAGDAFATGFLYGLLNQEDLVVCGRMGNIVASRCIRELGARKGLPSSEELQDLL